MAAQNLHDDPDFFAGYAQLPRSVSGLAAVFEGPAFQRLVPASLHGPRVLDLGCGMGYLARELRARGAREIVAVDISKRMLQDARAHTDDPAIAWPPHFVPAAASPSRSSIRSAPRPASARGTSRPTARAGGPRRWGGERRTSGFVGDVVKYHRTILYRYVNALLDAGCRLARLKEPQADPATLPAHREWHDERRGPTFLLVAADRRA